MDDEELPFKPCVKRNLSYISEGFEDEDDETAFGSFRDISTRWGPLPFESLLETVKEDVNESRYLRKGSSCNEDSVTSGASGAASSNAASKGPRSSVHSADSRSNQSSGDDRESAQSSRPSSKARSTKSENLSSLYSSSQLSSSRSSLPSASTGSYSKTYSKSSGGSRTPSTYSESLSSSFYSSWQSSARSLMRSSLKSSNSRTNSYNDSSGSGRSPHSNSLSSSFFSSSQQSNARSSLRSSMRSASTATSSQSNTHSTSKSPHANSLSSSFFSSSQQSSSQSSLRSSMRSASTNSRNHSHSTSSLVFTQDSKLPTATREVNIHQSLYFQEEVDETIPDAYKDAASYGHELLALPRGNDYYVDMDPSVKEEEYKFLPPEITKFTPEEDRYHESSPLSLQHRRAFAVVTVMAALSLSVAGVVFAAQVLSTTSPARYTKNYNEEYFYMPRYQFGGGAGGILGREVASRRVMYYARDSVSEGADSSGLSRRIPSRHPKGDSKLDAVGQVAGNRGEWTSSLRLQHSEQDPFDGFGPRQYHPAYSSHRERDLDKVTLTSTPLTSYNPPKGSGLNIVMDPMFHGSMMDTSVLPYNPKLEIPVFWDVPMTAGSRVQYVFGHCLKLVQCSEVGSELLLKEFRESTDASQKTYQDEQDSTLVLNGLPMNFDPPIKAEFMHSSTFINVDCSTSPGIDRGITHNLATANMVDIIYSPDILDAARLFAPPIKAYGRGMVLMRHPVERVVALYEYLRLANHELESVGGMSLEAYAKSDLVKDNFLTRTLSGNKYSILQDSDYEVAKEILQRKFIVGLYDRIEDSMERFELFFGWTLDANARACQFNELQREGSAYYNRYSNDVMGEDNDNEVHPGLTDAALESIMSKNKIDLMLFDYSKFLFDYQGQVLFQLGLQES